MAIKTYIVTVANPGAGNRYYIDGVLQQTVNLIEGYTYRFDQSDNTNGGHPFKFSTTSNGTHNGGSEYTTGVTINGTPGQAGSYTEIAVAIGAPQLYYYCQYHSGMGGQANTVDSSVMRVFAVTKISTGSGNKYVIDGVQQATVVLAEGYTYRFDQSDNSNSGHPYRFSTTSDGTHGGGSTYTTGVTTSGTPGQPGAYTQIAVAASAPQLYYYCTVHSGMGGSANTVSSNTWGVLKWNENSWGDQDGINVTPTGISFTSEIGSVISSADRGWGADTWSNGEWGEANEDTAVLTGLSFSADVGILDAAAEQGWGRDNWGQEPWGESNSPTVSLDGFSMSTVLGELPYAQSEEGWGRDQWGTGNWGQNTTSVAIEGLSMSAHLGPDGWGINSFGNGQWGDPFTFDVASIIVPTGQTLAADVGDLTISRLDMIFTISAPGTIGAGIGSLNVGNGADFTQGLASLTIEADVGSVVAAPNTIAALSGLEITAEVASLSVGSTELVDLTGVVLKGAIGSTTVDSMRVGLTGVTFAADEGAISPINMTVGLTGQSFTAKINTVGFGTIGYVDVDITGNTSYTDVNHAA